MKPLFLALLLVVSAQADIPGDVNQSGAVNITDVVDLVSYIFGGVEIPRKEWIEVDTTVALVRVLDRPLLTDNWPITVQNHFYVTVDDSGRVDTTAIREYIFREATYPSGNELIRSRYDVRLKETE